MGIFDHLRKRSTAPVTSGSVVEKPYLVVGLGNPGADYSNTRHNLGFMVADALAGKLNANYWKSLGGAVLAECEHQGRPLVLAKPQSFMNDSGKPVKSLLKYYGYAEGNLDSLLVIHDELDLPEGVLRLKSGGGHGGHRGILSIIENVGSDFARLRIGVGRPPGKMQAIKFVLEQVKGDTLVELETSVQQAVPILMAVLDDGLQVAMNRFN